MLLVYSMLGAGNPIPVVAGCLLLFVGVATVAARLVPGLVSVVGGPSRSFGGPAGRLANRNATRSPARTASAAAALMIGLALVTLFAVLGQGLRGSDRRAVEQQLIADYVVKADGDPGTLPTTAATALGSIDARVASVRFDRGRIGKTNVSVHGVDAAVTRAVHFDWTQGSDASIAALGRSGAVLPRSFASDHHLGVGDALHVPDGGRQAGRAAGRRDPRPPEARPDPRRGDRLKVDLRPGVPAAAGRLRVRGAATSRNRRSRPRSAASRRPRSSPGRASSRTAPRSWGSS